MIKKSYYITGFDCANCAMKAEDHLNRNPKIQMARIDFVADHLHIAFKDKEMPIEEILACIKEVETDPIIINERNDFYYKKTSVFTPKFFITLARALIGVIVIALAFTVFKDESYYWVNFSLYLFAILVLSYDVIFKVLRNIIKLKNPIDEYFLILFAAVGSFSIACIEHETHEFMEAVMVCMLFQIGCLLEVIATNRSKEAIISSIDLRSEYAHLFSDDGVINKKPAELEIGDKVLIKAGELVPIDGHIIQGTCLYDFSNLEGKKEPVHLKINDEVIAGSLIKEGEIVIEVNKKLKDSLISKVMDAAINGREKRSTVDKFITKFARLYTPVILAIALLFFIIGGSVSQSWSDYLIIALKMIVVACPCALVISIPLAYFAGVGLASKNGIIVKGTIFFDEMAKLKKLYTDKVGILTHPNLMVFEVHPVQDENELMESIYACFCLSRQSICVGVCHNKDMKWIAQEVKDFSETIGKGSSVLYKGNSIFAGTFDYVKDLCEGIDGKNNGKYIIHCVKNNQYLGYIVLKDEIKEDALPMVNSLHHYGIDIVILTDDEKEEIANVCADLGIKNYYPCLSYEEKKKIFEDEMENKGNYTVAYIGNTIEELDNMKAADISIAMGGISSDFVINNADVVIINDDSEKVSELMQISHKVRNVALFNIFIAIGVKILIEGLSIGFSLAGRPEVIPMWACVLGDSGLTIILVINSLLLLYRKIKHR